MGPNMKKLVAERAAQIAVEACRGGDVLGGVLSSLVDRSFGRNLLAAVRWCDAAVAVIRSAAEPNPWKTSTDEEIACELVRIVDERRAKKRARS